MCECKKHGVKRKVFDADCNCKYSKDAIRENLKKEGFYIPDKRGEK